MATRQTMPNPFPGLRPFNAEQDHLFFGREVQIQDSLQRLHETRFLAVVGPSGSGKSSLINAGLIPGMGRDNQSDTGITWRTVTLRPGDQPIQNLSGALQAAHVVGNDAEDQLREGVGLVDLVGASSAGPEDRLLLFVDQFEELFRFNRGGFSQQDAFMFVQVLLDAFQTPQSPIYVLMTLRADFLGNCTLFPRLPEAINEGQYLIPRMTHEQLRDAIVKPVAVGQASITPQLVERLTADLADNQDQLPLMQHALMRTWDYWVAHQQPDEPIDEMHYEAIGTTQEALSLHAEEVYAELSTEEERRIIQVVFKCLTDKSSNNRGVRRPTSLQEVCEVTGANQDAVVSVIDWFRQGFITPYSDVQLEPHSVLDLAHESVMRVWDRLVEWVEEEGAAAELYLRLANTAELYQEGRSGLYQGPDLELALNWHTQNRPTTMWAQRYDPTFERAITFLKHCEKEQDFEITTREERQRRQIRRTRVLAIGSGSASLIFLLLSLFTLDLFFKSDENRQEAELQGQKAVTQQKIAEQQRQEAELQSQKAVAQQKIAEQQRQEADLQRQKAVAQQKIANQERQRAELQSQKAVAQQKIAEQQRQEADLQRQKAVTQQEVANRERQKAERLRLLSVASTLAIQAVNVQKNEQVELGALLALQAYTFNHRYGGPAQNPNIYEALRLAVNALQREEQNILRGHQDGVRSVAFMPDGRTLISGGGDGDLRMWDLQNPGLDTRILRFGGRIRSIAVSPDGMRLAAGGVDGVVRVWTLSGLEAPPVVFGQEGQNSTGIISAVAFSKDGLYLAFSTLEGGVQVWDLAQPQAPPAGSWSGSERILCLTFRPTSQVLAWGSEDGMVRLGDLLVPDGPVQAFSVGKGEVQSLAFSSNGRLLASGTSHGDVLMWDVYKAELEPVHFLGHTAGVPSVQFHPDDRSLASGSLDKTVRIWDVGQPDNEPIQIAHDGWIWAVAFSPDGNRLVSGGADRNLRLWHPRGEMLAAQVCDQLNRNLSLSEWKKYVGSDISYERTCLHLPDQFLGDVQE